MKASIARRLFFSLEEECVGESHHGLLWSERPTGSPSKSYKPDYVIVRDATIFKGGDREEFTGSG